MKIALIGDYKETVTAHQAIPIALELASKELSYSVNYKWLNTQELEVSTLSQYSAIWCVPASPYQNTENAIQAIEWARVNDIPFLGTCGGYQHAALEFARNALGYAAAENLEVNPDASMALISGLTCKLYDETSAIKLNTNSRISRIYGTEEISEEYFCGFGVNREYLPIFDGSDITFSGFDKDGDPRSLEISKNRFFIGTAFQPERSALKHKTHPVIREFLIAAHTRH